MLEILKAKRLEDLLLDARLNNKFDREKVSELIGIYSQPATKNNIYVYFEQFDFEDDLKSTIGDLVRFNLYVNPMYWKEDFRELIYFHNANIE